MISGVELLKTPGCLRGGTNFFSGFRAGAGRVSSSISGVRLNIFSPAVPGVGRGPRQGADRGDELGPCGLFARLQVLLLLLSSVLLSALS